MIRTITRAAVGGYIRLVRIPFDAGLRLLGDGRRAQAEIALDRVDATARKAAGMALRDDELVDDANRRSTAAGERARGQSLRRDAEQVSKEADKQIAEREKHAERRRRETAQRSDERKKQAERRRESESRRLAEAETRRKAAAKKAAAETEAELNHRAKEERLEQLDQEAGALAQRGRALTAQEEAQRLRKAAAKTKAERKSD